MLTFGQMTREEAQRWSRRKKSEMVDRRMDRLLAREKDNPLRELVLVLRKGIGECKGIMLDLANDVKAQAKKIEKSSLKKTILRGELAQAEYELLEVQQKAEAEIQDLRARIEAYEHYFVGFVGCGGGISTGETETQADNYGESPNLS